MTIKLSEAELVSKNHKNTILSINCRSFNKNKDQILDLAIKLKPCIINCSEIFNPHNFKLPSYTGIKVTRSKRSGGGVGLLVKSDIQFEEYSAINNINTEYIEKLAIKITSDHNKYIFVGLYRAPSCNIKNSLKELDMILHTLSETDDQFILGGDLNINWSNMKDHNTKKYSEVINRFHVNQLINEDTRITCKTRTCLDHIITSSTLSIVQAKVLDIEIADHLSTITFWKKVKKVEGPIIAQSTSINYEKFNSLFTDQMGNIDNQNANDSNLVWFEGTEHLHLPKC